MWLYEPSALAAAALLGEARQKRRADLAVDLYLTPHHVLEQSSVNAYYIGKLKNCCLYELRQFNLREHNPHVCLRQFFEDFS